MLLLLWACTGADAIDIPTVPYSVEVLDLAGSDMDGVEICVDELPCVTTDGSGPTEVFARTTPYALQ